MARGKSFERVVSAACTAEGLAVGFCVSLLVVAALAYPVPAPKTLTEVKLDAYEHKNIKYVETERNRWKVWSRVGDAFYYANAPPKAQATRLAMQELSARGINFEPQPSTWLSRSIDMELALLGVVAKIIAFLATLAAFYHYYYEIYKKKHADSIEPFVPDPKKTAAAGLFDAKRQLEPARDFLQDPDVFESMGRRPPRGVLLAGEPGNGKTLLATWLAGEAGCRLLYAPASSMMDTYVGRGARRVREHFEKARASAPCVLFFDELDAIGSARSSGHGGVRELGLTTSALLCELDGARDMNRGVVVMMATNRKRVLDRALIRRGRVDIMIDVQLPRYAERLDILQEHLGKYCAGAGIIGPCVDLTRVAESTEGFSGADLMGVVQDAVELAVREGVKPPTIGHLLVAVEEASSPHSVVVAVEEEACVAAAQ